MSSRPMLHYQQKRPTTPDSACEHDWSPRPGMDTDLSDSNFSTCKSHRNKLAVTTGVLTNDSDGDSGIVTVRHTQRTGSTSSTDTDTSQETTSRNLSSYLLENHYNVVIRKGLKGTAQSNGPIKGDHSIPTSNSNPLKLSIFQPKDQSEASSSQQLVRFDDELQLNEQSIRRSCRKLFAALYAQKHSVPADNMPTCHHRTSVNIPVTNGSYPCCRSTNHQTCQRSLSSDSNEKCNASLNPPKARSNSLSESNEQSASNVYDMCHNIYSQKDANLEMVQAFARPAAVIPMTPVQKKAAPVPLCDDNRKLELRTMDHSNRTFTETVPSFMKDLQSKELTKSESEDPRGSKDFPVYQSTIPELRVVTTTPKCVSMPQLQMQNGNGSQQQINANCEVEYAVVDKSKKLRKNEPHAISYPCLSRSMSDDVEEPPVPPKKFLHRSDFALYQGPNAKKSFMGKIHGFTKSARSAIQRAFSTERIYRPQQEEQLDVSGRKKPATFIKGLKNRVSIKNKKKTPNIETVRIESTSSSPLWGVDGTDGPQLDHVCGQLIQLNVDGSQVIELTRPQGKPFGFFVARGRVKNSRGVFVSRMGDPNTQKLLSGLVDVGDEILEIDGFNVKNSDILEVNGLMSKKKTLLLTILPYICRKDI